MKKIVLGIMGLFLMLSLFGCAPSAPAMSDDEILDRAKEILAERGLGLDALVETPEAEPSQSIEPLPIDEPTPESTPEPTEEPISDVGTRKNPATIGQTLSCVTFSHEMEVTLLEVVRGDEAKSIAKKANRFNEYDEDVDLILAKFRIKITKDLTGEDSEYLASASSFDYADSSYAKEFTLATVAGLDEELYIQLYEGSEAEGYVCFEGKLNQEHDYLVFEDEYWFDLVAQ